MSNTLKFLHNSNEENDNNNLAITFTVPLLFLRNRQAKNEFKISWHK